MYMSDFWFITFFPFFFLLYYKPLVSQSMEVDLTVEKEKNPKQK